MRTTAVPRPDADADVDPAVAAERALLRLSHTPLPGATDHEGWATRVELAEHLSRWAASQAMVARVALARALPYGPDEVEWVSDVIAGHEGSSCTAAQTRLAEAHALTSMPTTSHLLAHGRISTAAAAMAARTCAHADPATIAEVDRRLWPLGADTTPQADSLVPGRVGRRTRQLLASLVPPTGDPADPLDPVTRGRQERSIDVWPGSAVADTRYLAALLTAVDAEAVWESLDARARACPAGDPRPLAARRADALVELVTGQGSFACWAEAPEADRGPLPGADRWRVSVTVPVQVLAAAGHPDVSPAELDRGGPITTETARLLLAALVGAGPRWQRLVTDPLTGALLDRGSTRGSGPVAQRTEPRHDPSPSLAAFVRARDGSCRFPGCHQRAARCDLDHVVPWSRGGPTRADNLVSLCRHHHRLKHAGGWQVDVRPGAALRWTTPAGRVMVSSPRRC